MTEAKFPKRRPDGTFYVEVLLGLQGELEASAAGEIERWLAQTWIPANKVWRRHWSTGVMEELRLEQELLSISAWTVGAGTMSLRLEGKSTAKHWRDWLVLKLVPDLRTTFPFVTEVTHIHNCPDENEELL